MFGKLLFFFVFPKLGISYKAKKAGHTQTNEYFLQHFDKAMLPQKHAWLRFYLHTKKAHLS